MSEKKVALITGGSRGIGRACVLKLAEAGFDIALTYAGNENAANETAEAAKALGAEVMTLKFDVSDFEAAGEGVKAVFEKFGKIDVLVNNAGITKDNLFLRMTAEDWNAVLNTNLSGFFNVTKPVVKIMMKQKFNNTTILLIRTHYNK